MPGSAPARGEWRAVRIAFYFAGLAAFSSFIRRMLLLLHLGQDLSCGSVSGE
jgi:hypothetical protein